MTKTCRVCKTEKSVDEFNKESRMKDGLTTACGDCIRNRNRTRYATDEDYRIRKLDTIERVRQRNIEAAREFLNGKACTDCGESDPVVLEFDHIDRSTKKADISSLVYNHASLSTVLDEISKCEVRCCNCHRRRTHQQLGWKSKGTSI